MDNGVLIFDEELYKENLKEHEFSNEDGKGLSEEDIEKLKKEGLYNE